VLKEDGSFRPEARGAGMLAPSRRNGSLIPTWSGDGLANHGWNEGFK